MLATEPPTASPHLRHPKPGGRKPLQPKNNFFITHKNHNNPPKSTPSKINHQPKPHISSPNSPINDSNKENWDPTPNIKLLEAMDASLAQELTAVKHKLERLKLEREKTDKMLQDRARFLQVQLIELHHRGEFQKELEIEVDRLYRLKQLKLASTRMSPIRSLREKELEKKNKDESQYELNISEKSGESKEGLVDESSTTESPALSFASSSASNSASNTSKSTATSKMLPISMKLSLEIALDDK
ncbi:hypothetical protein BVRB_7g156840 isoform B [Beta vulgaris subsp. vulgaris]|nr:hypothetical protein BVRB_7g156840 isoform B [Beta vulgaris subsp. vulgaris]